MLTDDNSLRQYSSRVSKSTCWFKMLPHRQQVVAKWIRNMLCPVGVRAFASHPRLYSKGLQNLSFKHNRQRFCNQCSTQWSSCAFRSPLVQSRILSRQKQREKLCAIRQGYTCLARAQKPHQDRHHCEPAILDLLHLELSKVLWVVCKAEGVKGTACIQTVSPPMVGTSFINLHHCLPMTAAVLLSQDLSRVWMPNGQHRGMGTAQGPIDVRAGPVPG